MERRTAAGTGRAPLTMDGRPGDLGKLIALRPLLFYKKTQRFKICKYEKP
jgi:hypothetical protein